MSRRKQSDPGEVSSKRWKSDDKVVQASDAENEWSEEEKNRLLEALKKDAGKNNWRSIARQVRTKDVTQVKLFASKIMAEKQGSSSQRPIAPKENNPLEAWISVTEKLKGDDDVDGTCIPQKRAEDCGSRLQDGLLTHQTENMVHVSDGTQKRKQEAQLTVDMSSVITNLQSFKESQAHALQDLISRMDDLLDHQNQLERKVSQLDSKVEALCVDKLSESTCQDMLQMLREQMDQLRKDALHRCLGGSVIIHAPPHAHIVHQPHVESCGTCMESCGTCMANTVHRKDKRRGENNVLPSITTCGSENVSRQSQVEITDLPEIEMSEANCTCVVRRLGDKSFVNGNKMPVAKAGAGSSEEVEVIGCDIAQRGMPAPTNTHLHRFAMLGARGSRQNSAGNVSGNLHTNACSLSYRIPSSQNAIKDVSLSSITHGTSCEKDLPISVGDGCFHCVVDKPVPVSSAATISANSHATNTVIFTQRTGLLEPSVTAAQDKTTTNTTITPLQNDLSCGLYPSYMVPAKSIVPPPKSSRTAISKCVNCNFNGTTLTAVSSSFLSQSTAQKNRLLDCVKLSSAQSRVDQQATSVPSSNRISGKPDSSSTSVTTQKVPLICPLTSASKVALQETQPSSAAPGLTVSLNHAKVVQNKNDIQQNKELPVLAGSTSYVDLVSRKSDAPFSCIPASVSPMKTCVAATKEIPHNSLQLLGTSSPATLKCSSPRTFAVTLTSRALPSTGMVELSDARHKATSNQPAATLPRMVSLPSSAVNVIRSAHSDVSGGAANEKQNDKALLCNSMTSQQELSFETNPSVESSYSQQDVLKAAVVISKFVSEQQSQQNQATWRSCLTGIANLYQKNNCNKDLHNTDTSTTTTPQVEMYPQTVFIGCNPGLVLTRCELEDILERSRGRPNFFAIRLAEQLYGEDVLVKSTPNGIGGKAALKPSILEAIKAEVLHRFAQDKSDFEKRELWKQCVTSIAQRCKRARHMSKKNTCDKMQGEMSVDESPCLPIIVTDAERLDDEYSGSDKSVAATDRNGGGLSNEAQLLSSNTAHFQPDKTSLGEEEVEKCMASSDSSIPMALCSVDDSHSSPREMQSSMELSSKTNEGMSVDNKHELPPGVDPDITVVHLPVSIQSPAVKGQVRSPNTELSSLEDSVGHFCDEHDHDMTEEKPAQHSERSQSSQAQETDSTDDLTEKDKFYGECLQVLGSIYSPSAQESTVTVSGIQMTRDFSQVIVGGNSNVVVPRQKYLDALERSSQPTHFAVRLAELTFGDDVLKASTVTGAKRGTKHLDATVLDAIQSELVERFMKDDSHEVQSIIWRKCLASIATRCKMLRYYEAKNSASPALPGPASSLKDNQ